MPFALVPHCSVGNWNCEVSLVQNDHASTNWIFIKLDMWKVLLLLVIPALSLSLPTAFEDSGEEDPERDMDPKQLGEYWGYRVEERDVTTPDGYILTVYRIPYGRHDTSSRHANRPVVFLQHGFETSAADWMINLPHQSAAYLFADAGFDVWIGNFRGNRYTQRHKTLDATELLFWQYSWYEMAMQDLSTMLNEVINETKSDKVYLVAHSLGTTAAFALLSQNDALAKKIRQFHAIAPLAELNNVQGVFKYAGPFLKDGNLISDLLSSREFPGKFEPNLELQEKWAKYICQDPEDELLCKNILLMVSGPNTRQINESRIDIINAHSPAGLSVQTLVNMGQMMDTKRFQAYDYGTPTANQQHYGRTTPPTINIRVQMPTFLYSSECDWVAESLDVANIASRVGSNLAANLIVPTFNHMDFIWGIRAAGAVYDPIKVAIANDFGPL